MTNTKSFASLSYYCRACDDTHSAGSVTHDEFAWAEDVLVGSTGVEFVAVRADNLGHACQLAGALAMVSEAMGLDVAVWVDESLAVRVR